MFVFNAAQLLMWNSIVSIGYVQSKVEITIGGLFTDAKYDVGGKLAFKVAVEYVNSRDDLLPNVTLLYVYNETTSVDGPFGLIQRACSLVQDNVGVVIGPATSAGVKAVAPIFTALEIPHIAPFATDPNLSVDVKEYPFLFKMSSPDTFQGQAMEDVVRDFGWSKISIIASATDYGRNGIRLFQTNALRNNWIITSVSYFFPEPNMSEKDFEQILTEIKRKGTRVILVNCMASDARLILNQASLMDMTGQGWAWLATDGITSLDTFFETCADVPDHLRGIIGTRPVEGHGALYDQYLELSHAQGIDELEGSCHHTNTSTSDSVDPPAYTMRVFDAVVAAAYGLHSFLEAGNTYRAPSFVPSVCDAGIVQPWSLGQTLKKHIANVSGDGVMNHLSFTDLQYTTARDYDVVNLRKNGWLQVGNWTNDRSDRLQFDEPVYFHGLSGIPPTDSVMSLINITLRVVTILEAPYVMLDEESPGKSKYVGFCMDLLERLSHNLGFKYEVYLVPDGQYGGQNPETKEWNGLVNELIKKKADMAVASMTISYEREQYIDFTKPFQDLGAIVLMAKEKSEDNFLAFLDPFSWGLWGAVLAAFVVCGVANAVVSWVSPYGHRGRYSSRLNTTSNKNRDDRNVFNLWNSLWFSFAQWMMQGAESSPASFSGRIVYGVWYFVVMVVAATYTANLAAFLTIQRLDSGISSIDDLAKQTSIKYGTVANSAIQKFFDTQVSEPYLTMSKFMEEKDTLIQNASHGIELVRKSYGKPKDKKYAFVFDSAPLEYAASMPPCEIDVVGRIFNQFGYGLGLPKGTSHVQSLSLEILKLRQSGYLQSLKNKWITAGSCTSKDDGTMQTPHAQQASFGNMAGVFCFMLIGLGLVGPVILCEYCVAVSRDKKHLRKPGKNTRKLNFNQAFRRRCNAICTDTRRRFSVCVGCHDSSSDESDAENTQPETKYRIASGVKSTENGHPFDGKKNGFTNFSYGTKDESQNHNNGTPSV